MKIFTERKKLQNQAKNFKIKQKPLKTQEKQKKNNQEPWIGALNPNSVLCTDQALSPALSALNPGSALNQRTLNPGTTVYFLAVCSTNLNFLTVWSECFLRMEAIFLLISETFDSCFLGTLLRDISSSFVSREASTKFWVDLELADDWAELLRESSPPASVPAAMDPRADSWSHSPEERWLSDLSKEQAPSSVQVTGAITLICKSHTHP